MRSHGAVTGKAFKSITRFVHRLVFARAPYYVYTRAKVSGFMNVSLFITFRVFGFARRYTTGEFRFLGIRIQRFHFKFQIQKFPDS